MALKLSDSFRLATFLPVEKLYVKE